MWLLILLKTVFEKVKPVGSVAMLPFLTIMLLSLASSLYTVSQMLRRKSTGETILALAIPYVLFGTLFIVEPLLIASLFGAENLLSSVVLIMSQTQLYLQILILVGIFALSAWLFSEAASRKMGGTRKNHVLRNCGFEVVLCILLVVVSVLAQFQKAPAFLLMDMGLKIFIYALVAIIVKTAVNLFLALYTLLFHSRKEKKSDANVFTRRQDMPRVHRFIRRKAGYGAILLGLFLLLFGFAVSRSIGLSLWYINALLGLLCLFWFYQILRFLLPDLTTTRRFSRWGNEDDIAALFCREFLDGEPVVKKEHYTLTSHFLVNELHFGVKIYYLPLLESQNGLLLQFSDGSRCRLRKAFHGLNMDEYVRDQASRRNDYPL